jgi:hypothetical protein
MKDTHMQMGHAQTIATPPVNIVVLIDALGWQILKDRPFLNDELRFRTPLKTVLGFSSGAIPSILTGLAPSRTGRWNLFYYDPGNSPFRWLRFFSGLPDKWLNNRYVRKLIKELGRRVLGMGPLFECGVSPRLLSWFNWSEKSSIYAAGGIAGSTSIFDLLKERNISHRIYSYHTLTDSQILEQAKSDIAGTDATFFFLYLSEVDHFLHGECTDEKSVTDQLVWYESQLHEIFELAAKRDAGMTFTVISDHGMTPVHSRYDLVCDVESLGFQMPKDYLAVYDSTMARYWFFSEVARRAIVGKLAKISCGRILNDSQLEQLGILFPDRKYGEVIFLLDPGWLVAQSDFNGSDWNPAGMHGYHPSDSHSDAIFLSNHDPHRELVNIMDIYPCLKEAVSAA